MTSMRFNTGGTALLPSPPQIGSYGQLGNGGDTTRQSQPVAVSGGRTFSIIAAGSWHSCAITEAGSMWCWGDWPQNGQATTTRVPAEVGGGHTFVAVSAGEIHTCGLDASGDMWCFGACVCVRGFYGCQRT